MCFPRAVFNASFIYAAKKIKNKYGFIAKAALSFQIIFSYLLQRQNFFLHALAGLKHGDCLGGNMHGLRGILRVVPSAGDTVSHLESAEPNEQTSLSFSERVFKDADGRMERL
jgi:hypothetical protein